MVARERGERQIRQCLRINPHHLINFRSRFNGAFDIDGIHRGAHLKSRLVGCRAIEHAKRLRAVSHHATAQFFGNLTRELYQTCIAEKGPNSQVDTVGQFFDRLAGTAVVPAKTDLTES